MTKPIFYVDLDNTLIAGDVAEPGKVVVYKRPGTHRFLSILSGVGDLCLLTHGVREHADESLRVIGVTNHFKKVLSREDLDRVVPGVGPRLGAPGFMFDDYPVGSWLYDLKSTAIGIGPRLWIQVEKFSLEHPDKGGLKKALNELCRRMQKIA